MFKEEKELWVKFACAALVGMSNTFVERYETDKTGELSEIDIIRDDVDTATRYADEMVAAYYGKFKDC